MNWRTDKPTADVIVAEIKDRGYKIMYASNCDTFHYLDDNGEEYEYTEFVKWADLEEGETVTKTNMIFEDCLANVDPQIRKEVSDKIDEAIQTGTLLQDEDETATDCHELEGEVKKYINNNWNCEHTNKNAPLYLYDFSDKDLLDAARHFAKWGADHLKN